MNFTVADLRPGGDEEVIRRELSRLLDDVWVDGARQSADGEAALWEQLRGWSSVAERPLAERCVALEVAGAHLLPGAFSATVGLLAPLLALVDTERHRALVEGRLRGTAGVIDGPGASWAPPSGPLLGAEDADVVALVEGTTVHLVAPRAVVGEAVVDPTRRFGRLTRRASEPLAAPQRLGEPELEHWLACGAVALAADMVGGARALCALAVAHAGERVQFGRPIGTFQAVQHRLVAMTILAQRAGATVQYAAAALERGGPEALAAAHVAKSVAAEAVTRCGRDALQLHGATGYTWENDVHLHLRRGYASDAVFGDRLWHRRRLAERIVEAGEARSVHDG